MSRGRTQYITDDEELNRESIDAPLRRAFGDLPAWGDEAPVTPPDPVPATTYEAPQPKQDLAPPAAPPLPPADGANAAVSDYIRSQSNPAPEDRALQQDLSRLQSARTGDAFADFLQSLGANRTEQTTLQDQAAQDVGLRQERRAAQRQRAAEQQAQRQEQESLRSRRGFWTQAMREAGIDPAQFGPEFDPEDARSLVSARNRHEYRLNEIDARGQDTARAAADRESRERIAAERNRTAMEIAELRRRRGGGGGGGASSEADQARIDALIDRQARYDYGPNYTPEQRAETAAIVDIAGHDRVARAQVGGAIAEARISNRELSPAQRAQGAVRHQRNTADASASVRNGQTALNALRGMGRRDISLVAQGLSFAGNTQALSQFLADNPTANRDAIGAVGTYLSARLKAQSGLTASEQEVKRLLSQMQAGQAVDPQAFLNALGRLLQDDQARLEEANAAARPFTTESGPRGGAPAAAPPAPTATEEGVPPMLARDPAPTAATTGTQAPQPGTYNPPDAQVRMLAQARGMTEEAARAALIRRGF